jgi:hypothetical protein
MAAPSNVPEKFVQANKLGFHEEPVSAAVSGFSQGIHPGAARAPSMPQQGGNRRFPYFSRGW